MIVRWLYGELVVLDLSETGTQLGEKLSLLLDDKQQKELAHYLKGRRFIYLSGASTGNDPGTGNYFDGKRI